MLSLESLEETLAILSDPELLAAIREAYDQSAVRFRWQKDDVLLIDNMLTSHARDPYSGPRKIVVAMAELYPK